MNEERRLVTVLFADVIGSTGLGETLDPEDLRLLLSRYYELAKTVLGEFGGTLEKFIGDAVVAIFGVPHVHDDDAARACGAALELRDRVRDDPGLGERLPIRIGINTGEVVTNPEAGGQDFVITGDAVNIAARLQQSAAPWSILAGERTTHAAPTIRFGPSAMLEVRGRTAPVAAREVLEASARAAVSRLPMVGREADLQQLELLFARVVSDRRPYVVSVIAPPGTGKTRLLEAFRERLAQQVPQPVVAVAQCLPYGERLTYWPLRSLLLQLVGLPDAADADDVRSAIGRWLDDGVADPGRVAELLAATIGIGEAESVDRAELFAAWREALEAAARRTTLVIAFEDLHWASDSMLELVEFVMRPRGETRLLMIALARPELLDRRAGWGGGQRNYVALSLEPLDPDAMRDLLRQLLAVPSPDLVSAIAARAEGNPFYAAEMVRSAIERAGSADDPAAVRHALAGLPDTVQATLLARLDLLPRNERRLLQVASIFGHSFHEAEVAALAPDLASALPACVEQLSRRELIDPAGARHHSFRHILIRDAAYDTLPRVERARLHAGAAAWLEERSAANPNLAELIAYHYREAVTLPSALERERLGFSDVRQRAVDWLVRAADQANAGAAMREAAAHLVSAIDLADASSLPSLYQQLGEVLQGEGSVEASRTALELVRRERRPADEELRILGNLLLVYTRSQGSLANRPTLEEMEQLRADGTRLLEQAKDPTAQATFLIAQAFFPFWDATYTSTVELAEAEASAQRGLALAGESDEPNLRSTALDALASLAESRGDWVAGRSYSRKRLEFEDRLMLVERVDARAMVAWSSTLLGDLSEAARVSYDGLAPLLPTQAPPWQLHLRAWGIYARVLLGRWDEALTLAEDGIQVWQRAELGAAGFAVRGFIAALDVARARRNMEASDRVGTVLREILQHFPDDDDAPGPGLAWAYLGPAPERLRRQVIDGLSWTMDTDHDDPSATDFRRIDYFERVLSLLCDLGSELPPADLLQAIAQTMEKRGFRPLQAQALRALGLTTTDPRALDAAHRLFLEMEAAPYVMRTRAELAVISGDRSMLSRAIRGLAALGDLQQQERYLAASKGSVGT